ncbi:MAG: hypothetical protein HRT89_24790 [Lentisphaeria bacterium]|nr:hypothetical protein [Lentisphaeria bacterium]NQZ71275.1 hypothetical protein [Lentisphaeria bacterium]
MTEEDIYLFDLQGFIVLKNVVKDEWIKSANKRLDDFEVMDPERYPEPLVLGTPKTDDNLYISNILEGGSEFVPFMDIPDVLGTIERITGGGYRLK